MAPATGALYRNLLAYQVYGANTNVGKTVFSTILCKAFETRYPTWYLKPVSTGPESDDDSTHVHKFAQRTTTKCLWRFTEPVSPHIAAKGQVVEDSVVIQGLLGFLDGCSSHNNGSVIVETAGGVHSPTPSGTSQADLYRPLRLPILLVGDPKLGGISSTIAAYESLHVRGFSVDALLIFQDSLYNNHDYLSKCFRKRKIHTIPVPPPPLRLADLKDDAESLSEYYEKVSKSYVMDELLAMLNARHIQRLERLDSMSVKAIDTIWYPFTQHKGLRADNILTIDSAYGDFFQTMSYPSSSTADNKIGGQASLLKATFDASASWWTQGLGHGSPDLSLAASHAAGRYGHVMFAGAIHEPALSLAEMLLSRLQNPRLAKVFYSDNGSSGMEVAIKMALTATCKRYGYGIGKYEKGEIGVLGLKNSYHGDTIGAMDAVEKCTFNDNVHWYKGRGYWFDFPKVSMKNGMWRIVSTRDTGKGLESNEKYSSLEEIFSLERDCSNRRRVYEKYIIAELTRLTQKEGKKFGALLMEPIILGVGGMHFCDPLFQRTLVETVRSHPEFFTIPTTPSRSTSAPHAWTGLPVIFDEVFTGLYRLGHFTPSTLLHVHPDISCHAKLLSGGLLPLCATIASNSIYDAFTGDSKADALLHGHSYTAHAVGCEVARQSIDIMTAMEHEGAWANSITDWIPSFKTSASSQSGSKSTAPALWSTWSQSFVKKISHFESVESIIALGSVLAITLIDETGDSGYNSDAAVRLRDQLLIGSSEGFNVHSRVLGNVLYVISSLNSDSGLLKAVEKKLEAAFEALPPSAHGKP